MGGLAIGCGPGEGLAKFCGGKAPEGGPTGLGGPLYSGPFDIEGGPFICDETLKPPPL